MLNYKFFMLAMLTLTLFSVQSFATDVIDLRIALQDRLAKVEKDIRNQDVDDIIPPLDFGRQLFKEGDAHPDVPLLRAKLMRFIDEESFEADPYLYDSTLVEGVKRFQRDIGMKDDGIVGPATLTVLNRTLDDEREQILVNLHRLEQPEWLGRPDLRIDVDLARYYLSAYENGKMAFEMPVVVGSPQRKTVRFSTVMTGVRLNPGWTLPPTIKQEDYIPKLRENPEWLTEQGVKIYSSWDRDAQPIDPTTIDWNYLSDNEIKAMRFYKNAGSANPLGKYRFLMNNRYDIYLHDTNQKYLFNRSARAKSSGCVRVFDPRRIAEFLLKDNPDWTSEKIDAVLAGGKTYNVGAKRSIPVYFDYKTAWLDEGKKLVLGHDIYGLDDSYYRDIVLKEFQTSEAVKK